MKKINKIRNISLNPRRCVGVLIEDRLTEKEFKVEMILLNNQLIGLSK